ESVKSLMGLSASARSSDARKMKDVLTVSDLSNKIKRNFILLIFYAQP
ncbi:3737_t:CDS:1, partial [Funneliformis geosporum]